MTKKRTYGTGSLYKRGRVWWIKYHRRGRAFFESSRSEDKRDAEVLLKKRVAEIATGQFAGLRAERIRVSDLCQLARLSYFESGFRARC